MSIISGKEIRRIYAHKIGRWRRVNYRGSSRRSRCRRLMPKKKALCELSPRN